jgi:hypothetical protein
MSDLEMLLGGGSLLPQYSLSYPSWFRAQSAQDHDLSELLETLPLLGTLTTS